MQPTIKLGQILFEKNLISSITLERVVLIAKKLRKRLGVVLEEMGLITEDELAHCLALQYNLKVLPNFAKAAFPPEVLKLLPAEVALAHLLFPLKLEGNRLALAVADPTDAKIVRNMADNNDLSISVYVSTRSEIKAAICKHYFDEESIKPTRKTVLVVDDDRTVLADLENVLSKHYQVITATDGMEAYRAVIGNSPHVVLTDDEMPKLSGFGLLTALRAVPQTKQIPVILISGTGTTIEAQAFDNGFFDFIMKPFNETTLLTRVKRAYESSEKQNYLFLK